MQYPPAPWTLQGRGVLLLHLLDTSRAQPFVPAGFSILSVLLGKTLGGIFLATYEAGSSLAYHELIVIPALVRYRGRPGAWISHIYVDDQASAAGGRKLWGLPKALAEFTWDAGEPGQVIVRQGGQVLCSVHPGHPSWLGRLPIFLPALSRQGEARLWFKGTGTARLGIARGRVMVPPGSPFSPLGLGQGLCVHLDRLRATVHAPVSLG